MKPPSKEACEQAAAILLLRMDDEPGLDHPMIHTVAAYLRSLHEPCPTCGKVGGGGRVKCRHDAADGYCSYRNNLWNFGGKYRDGCGYPGADDACTVPCPDCGGDR